MLLYDISYSNATKRTNFDGMRSDPLLTITHLERRFQAMLQKIIYSPQKPLGNVVDYFYRVEFQNRGSAHYHTFFWVANIPKEIDEQTIPLLIDYLNRVIHTSLPNADQDPELYFLASKLQTHHHSSYCLKNPQAACRFHFPRRPVNTTQIFTNANIIQSKGSFYELKRNNDSTLINNYNSHILRHFRSNMDIQFVHNAESVAYYVCSYVCKNEPDELKMALANLISQMKTQSPPISSFARLWKIGTTVLRHRKMSAQEAAYKMSSFSMVHMSRRTVYLNAREVRARKLKRDIHTMPRNDTDVFQPNLLDYYRKRPDNLENLSLFSFAAWYEQAQPLKNPQNIKSSPRIYIDYYNLDFRKRNTAAIVRYPKYQLHTPEYYYSMLFLPHRHESNLTHDNKSHEDLFLENRPNFDRNALHIVSHLGVHVENAIRRIQAVRDEMAASENDINDVLCPTYNTDIQHTNQSDLNHPIPQEELCSSNSPNIDLDICYTPDTHQTFGTSSLSTAELHHNVAFLTNTQKIAFNYISQYFKDNNDTPLRLFVSGSGGTGKSYLITTIIAHLQQFHSIFPGKSPVLVAAPTGTAARYIRGSTLHSLLKIPVTLFDNYEPLHPSVLQEIQFAFHGTHTIIMDEISMVSSTFFTYISRRLNEISGNDEPFGSYNMILTGDLFQLKPVTGLPIYRNHKLWHLFAYTQLNENVRQAGDPIYARLLNRARQGILLDKDIQLLISCLCDINTNDQLESLHIFPLIHNVSSYNEIRQNALTATSFLINAIHYFSAKDSHPGDDVPEHLSLELIVLLVLTKAT